MEKIENNSQGVLALTNKVRMEGKDVKGIGLPLDAFPQKIRVVNIIVLVVDQLNPKRHRFWIGPNAVDMTSEPPIRVGQHTGNNSRRNTNLKVLHG